MAQQNNNSLPPSSEGRRSSTLAPQSNNKDESSKKTTIGKIVVDRDACIGAGSCTALAPGTFALDNEGKAIVINVNGDNDKNIIDAAMSCPVLAIKVYDVDGNQIYPK